MTEVPDQAAKDFIWRCMAPDGRPPTAEDLMKVCVCVCVFGGGGGGGGGGVSVPRYAAQQQPANLGSEALVYR